MGGEIGGAELSDVIWQASHSIKTRAGAEFAWRYWTDVGNWDDPPARFEFTGAFVTGARGLTHLPGQPPIEWFVRDVMEGSSATIEIPADGAVLSFDWKFEAVAEGSTLLTQRIVLRGRDAEKYLGYARTLEENLPLGMKKMASAIEKALAETVYLNK
jgi:hypothetical protein